MNLWPDNENTLSAVAAAQAGSRSRQHAHPGLLTYGERTGVVVDPFGHRWMIGHEIERLTPGEMQRRYTAMMDTD